jgi:WD40 repeat protein/DNA-binding SARP family transcriptional activator
MKRLELRLFGTFQATLDGEPLTGFRSDKVRALLAYLVLEERQTHRRQSLAALLWGEQSDQSASLSLRVSLHNLRQVLDSLLAVQDEDPDAPPLLTITRQSLQFNAHHPACWVDAVEFDTQMAAQRAHLHRDPVHCATCVKRMKRMVELYKGDLLAGLTLADSPAFDEWQTVQQEARHQQALGILHALAAHYEILADYGAVEHYARRQIELNPWDEEGHHRLMWALAMSGQRAAALAQYEACRSRLQQELGSEPSAETAALYREILDGTLGWDAEAAVDIELRNPYKGLQPFEETDTERFFGRETLIDRLLTRLGEGDEGHDNSLAPGNAEPAAGNRTWMNRLLAIVGPSGSGKSSLVRAGLIPALHRAGAQGGSSWMVATMFPGEDPEAELVAALEAVLPPGSSIEMAKGQDPDSWPHVVRERLPPETRLLLFIDQAEELFTLIADQATRVRFVAGLLAGLQALPGRLWIIVTLRADYYDRPLRFPEWSYVFYHRLEITPPLTPEELERAITGPAARAGVSLEDGLVPTLLSDVGGEPGSLPLLQYTLTELFERRAGRTLTLSAYQAMGGLAGALAGRAEELYSGLDASEQSAARQLFLRLVVPGDADGHRPADARRRMPRREMEPLGDEPGAMRAVLDVFGRHRFLTFDRNPTTGEATVEIAHEVLLAAWPRLRGWLKSSREAILLQRRLAAAAQEWVQSGQELGFLAGGPRLTQFETLLAAAGPALTPVESEYLNASLAERDRRQTEEQARLAREAAIERRSRSRLRALVAVLSVVVVVALGLLAFALNQQRIAQREAAIAHSLNLATGAQLALNEGDTDLALALALEANQLPDPPPQAQRMLAEAAYAPGARHVFLGHNAAVEDVALAPGRMLSASADGTLILWDISTGLNAGLESGEPIRRLVGHTAAVNSVAFLPGEERAISASSDGTLILWDVESGEAIRTFHGHDGPVWDVAVSPSCVDPELVGCVATSGSDDGTLTLWDMETGEALRHLTGHEGAIHAVAFGPDGRTALSGSADHSLILWDLQNGQIIHHLSGAAKTRSAAREGEVPESEGHEGPVQDVAFGPDGRTAYSVADDRRLMVWDLQTGMPLRTATFGAGIYGLDVSPDGRYILLGMFDSRVILWMPYYAQSVLELMGHTGRVEMVTFLPDGRQAVSGAADGTLRLWDLRSGAEERSLIYDGSALDVALSPDGRQILLASSGGDLSLWDYGTGAEIRRMIGHTETPFAGVLFCPPDGNMALSGGGDVFGLAEDNTLRLWDVETGRELRHFEGHTDRLWDIDVSADGRFAVSGSADGTVRLWDLQQGTGTVLTDVRPQAVRSVAITPDGGAVLIGLIKGTSSEPDFGLRLVDRETGVLQRTFSGHTDVVSDLAFSAEGDTVLSGGQDKLVILWDFETGQEIWRFVGHTGGVNQVRFSPDGRFVLSAGLDNVMILWDVETGAALRRYTGHAGGILGIAFTPGGRSFLSVAVDDSVREWRIDAIQEALGAWIESNRHISELTCQQRAQYHVEPLCGETGAGP